jgi:fructokinase
MRRPIVRIGIDLGGTKIAVIALDRDGVVLFRRRVQTPGNYVGTLDAVVTLVADAERVTGRVGTVGIGIPGAISPASGRVQNANSTWLIGHRLDEDLASRLGRQVVAMNDANCFALSEATDGAGQGHEVVFGVILGTGVGGGIVIDRRIVEGPQRIAGEWGHNPMPEHEDPRHAKPTCYCGRTGCVETYLSGPGLARDHEHVTGRPLTPIEIIAQAAAGEPAAMQTLERYVARLGMALATVVNILDPDVIVLGGGLSNIPHLAARAERSLHAHLFTDHPSTPVRRNTHGDDSGVRGAAWLGARTMPVIHP